MKNIRLSYLKGLEWKVFSTRKAFLSWSQDPLHDGTYYVSFPEMTCKYTREQISKWR